MVSILIGQPGERNPPSDPGRKPTLPVIRSFSEGGSEGSALTASSRRVALGTGSARDLLPCLTNRTCRGRSLVALFLGMTGNWLLGMTTSASRDDKRSSGLRRHFHDRADLDRARPRRGDTCRDRRRLVQVLRIDDVVAAELFAGLGEGAVGRQRLAVADADGRGGRNRLERVAGAVFPALLDAFGESPVLLVDGAFVLLVEGLPVHLPVVNQKHVSHRFSPFVF